MCEVSRGKLVVVLLKKNSKSNTYKICWVSKLTDALKIFIDLAANSGFSDAVDGHSLINAGTCDQEFSYEMSRAFQPVDVGFQEEYLTQFQPNGFLKVYTRYTMLQD